MAFCDGGRVSSCFDCRNGQSMIDAEDIDISFAAERKKEEMYFFFSQLLPFTTPSQCNPWLFNLFPIGGRTTLSRAKKQHPIETSDLDWSPTEELRCQAEIGVKWTSRYHDSVGGEKCRWGNERIAILSFHAHDFFRSLLFTRDPRPSIPRTAVNLLNISESPARIDFQSYFEFRFIAQCYGVESLFFRLFLEAFTFFTPCHLI